MKALIALLLSIFLTFPAIAFSHAASLSPGPMPSKESTTLPLERTPRACKQPAAPLSVCPPADWASCNPLTA